MSSQYEGKGDREGWGATCMFQRVNHMCKGMEMRELGAE